MKVAIITDQHFGARNDSVAFLDFYEKFYRNNFFPAIDSSGIDTLLVLGDTFDRRKYMNFYALDRAKKMFFEPLRERGITVHMIAGNHDTYFKNTNEVNSPELLLNEYKNINIISEPTTVDVGGYDVCFMPWICAENYEASVKELKETKSTLCMGHFEIEGFVMHRGMVSHDGLHKDLFKKFDMVFSGHYHHKSDDGQIYYLGNPYELTWNDAYDPRGFHFFDLETRKLEFVQNQYTMFQRIEYNDKGQEPIDLDKLDLAEKIVKLVVVNKTDYYKFDKFVNKLYTLGCQDIKVLEDLSEYDNGELQDETINLEDTVSVLSNYIDSVETDYDKDKLKTYMRGLYTEAVNIEVV